MSLIDEAYMIYELRCFYAAEFQPVKKVQLELDFFA